MKGDLLWVYEGLTQYLGNILTPRSGLYTPEEYREDLARTTARSIASRAACGVLWKIRRWLPSFYALRATIRLHTAAASITMTKVRSSGWKPTY
jgi:hypothetical protein